MKADVIETTITFGMFVRVWACAACVWTRTPHIYVTFKTMSYVQYISISVEAHGAQMCVYLYVFWCLSVPAVGEMDKKWQETSEMDICTHRIRIMCSIKKAFRFYSSCEALYVPSPICVCVYVPSSNTHYTYNFVMCS